MAGWVAAQNLVQTFLDVDLAAVDGGSQVAVRQGLEQELIGQGELLREPVDAPLVCLDQRAGVMRDEAADHWVGAEYVAEVPGAVERMESCGSHRGRVADVMQERGRLDQLGPVSENRRQLNGASSNALRMCPATRQLVGQ